MAAVQSNYAAIWSLTNVLKAAAKPESAFGLGPGGVDQEALIGGIDGRTIVSPEHFANGGKYRCTQFSSQNYSVLLILICMNSYYQTPDSVQGSA